MIDFNSIMAAILLILGNFGARYLHLDLDKKKEEFLSHPYMRCFYVFCLSYASMRNLITSGVTTALWVIFVKS